MRDCFWHEHNILTKAKDKRSNTYFRYKDKFKKFYDEKYKPYQTQQFAITGISKEDINKKLKLLEEYYKEVEKFIKTFSKAERSNLSSRAKLRPTILEEFCCYLFKDVPEIKKLELDFFNKKIFAGLMVDENGKTKVRTKDVDFCIGKEVKADFEGNKQTFIVPIVAVECKTYTDKTMFSEAQFTAQTLKRGSPNVKVFVLSEVNQVALEEIPSQTPIDQYFALRGGKGDDGKEIDPDVLMDFFTEIKETIRKTTELKVRKIPGKLIIN